MNPFEAELQRRQPQAVANPFEAELARRGDGAPPMKQVMDPEPSMIEGLNLRERLPSRAEIGQWEGATAGRLNQNLADELALSKTHYQTLARGVGMPAPEPSDEEKRAYDQAVISMLLTTGAGKAADIVASKGIDALKYLGRGFRTRGGAERFLARPEVAPRVVAAGEQASAGVKARELIDPALSGTAVGALVDASDPTPWELTDKSVAGGAGITAAAGVAKNTIDDLLVGNPRWRDLMMREPGGWKAKAIGGIIGYYTAKGLNLGADTLNDIIDYFTGQPGGEQQP